MLSCLSQGVGSLNGDVEIDLNNLKSRDIHYTLPPVLLTNLGPQHRHGITINSRIKSAQSSARSEKPDGELVLPKTLTTRKGALLLFTAPEKVPGLTEEEQQFIRKQMRVTSFQELSQKIGTLHRLTKSVLMYGDEVYEKDDTSISDEENKIILKFLHGLDERAIDMRAQPGGDFGSYLRDVKTRASSARLSSDGVGVRFDDNVSISTINDNEGNSAELLTANSEKLTEPFHSSRPLSSASSRRSFKVLSTDRLTASLKSANLLETPSPVSTRYSYDDVLVRHYPERVTSAQPRRWRRPPPQRRAGSGNDLKQRRQRGDELSVKSEHRKQQMLRRQRKAEVANGGQGQVTEGQGQVADYKADEVDNTLAQSLAEEVISEEETLQNTVLSGETSGTGDDKRRESQITQENKQTRTVTSPSSPKSNRSSPASQQETDPGGISSVVIRQVDGTFTDRVISSERDRDDLITHDDDRVSISSSVLEEQDIDLPSEDEGRPSKWSDARHTQQTDQPPAAAVKEKLPIAAQEETFEGEFEQDVQTLIENEGGLSPPAAADAVDEDEMYDDDADYGDEDYEDEDYLYEDGEEYDDFEEEDYNEQVGATQPLMPHYTGTLFSGGAATFSLDNTLAETQDLADIVIDEGIQMLPHTLDSVAGSRPDTATQDDSPSEAATPSAPPPSPPGSRMSACAQKRVSSRASSSESRHGSAAGSAPTSQAGSAPPSRAGSAKKAKAATRKSLTTEKLVASTESFDQVKEPSSSRSTPVEDIVPAEYLKEHQFLPGGHRTQSEAGRTLDSGIGTDTPRLSLKPDSTADSSSVLQESPVPAPSVTVKLPVETDNAVSTEELVKNRVNFKPTPKIDERKTPHEPKDVTKAIGITSKVVESYQPSDSESHTSPSIPNNIMELPPSEQKQALHLEKEKAKVNKLEKEVEAMLTQDHDQKYDEGMTVEELELEQKILEEKMKKAEKIASGAKEEKPKGKKPKIVKKEPITKDQRRRSTRVNENKTVDLEEQRKALQQKKEEEKKRRLEQAMEMQAKIMEKEISKKKELEEAAEKTAEIEEQMAALAHEAENAEQLEEEAKVALVAARKAAREEREVRRKQEQERRRQEAAQKRRHEWDMMDRAKKKEMEMLANIRGADAHRKLMEEEKWRREEQEEAELMRLEEEERLARIAAEEEERRIAAIEKEAEEEALSRLRKERDEAERKRRQLMIQAERLAEIEEQKRQAFLEEQRIAEEERRKIEEKEERKREEERQRLLQLKKMEEEARERMRLEFDKRREMLLKRREKNIEARNHLQGIRTSQGMTRPWTFSYYVLWPRATYERLIGGEGDSKKKGGGRKKPKGKK